MISIKGIIDKVASRKLGVTAVAGAAAATGAVEVKKKPPSHPSGGGGGYQVLEISGLFDVDWL